MWHSRLGFCGGRQPAPRRRGACAQDLRAAAEEAIAAETAERLGG